MQLITQRSHLESDIRRQLVFVWGDPNEYRAVVMKIRIFLAASILLVSGQVGASIISISASAEMTGGSSLATNLFPIGTKVVADLSFDVGLGNRSTASITDVSGSFSWMDSIFGLQSYDAKNAYIRNVSYSGWFDVLFWASDRQTVGDITANAFGIKFINGVDTFRPPEVQLNFTICSWAVPLSAWMLLYNNLAFRSVSVTLQPMSVVA
jgi:hypothetical protein